MLFEKDIDYDWYCLCYFSYFLITLHDLLDSALKLNSNYFSFDETHTILLNNNLDSTKPLNCTKSLEFHIKRNFLILHSELLFLSNIDFSIKKNNTYSRKSCVIFSFFGRHFFRIFSYCKIFFMLSKLKCCVN